METLQQYCITSAKHYLEYLEKYNLGLEEIKILDAKLLHNKTLLLVLEKPLLSTDYLQLCIGTFILDIDSVANKSFNNVTHVLQLQLSHDIMAISPNNIELSYCTDNPSSLESHDKQEITYQDMPFLEILDNDSKWQYNLRLFVDLKFLVKNIYDFCKHDSFRFAFPTKKPIQFTLPFDSHVSEEQQNAIKGIFSHSISYIWGISGSGKTQIVLFHALLNLIKQNKKALILAPTNTALEQIFISLIRQCDKRGISRYNFLRLGISSSDFLQNFREVCLQDENDEKEQNNNAKDKELFAAPTLKERLRNCLAIGVTLDSFIKRYHSLSNLDFAHIFLDECAFSPLIKLIAPLSLNVPITLLGDHKQLMPICLMQDSEIKRNYKEVCLWNLNALFLEEAFHNIETLHTKDNHNDIQFDHIAHYKLTTTYRYGNNLAQILDKYVYLNGLKGLGLPTQIYYVDSVNFGKGYENQGRNTNEGEANAIKFFIDSKKDYAILTPFRDQQQLLIQKGIQRNRVFTIHKSQGKEFDTIIFSPVKLSKYLTNSHNTSALFALNVAISRLKKELIIVCSYHFWIRQHGQLIASLLHIATPYPLHTSLL